MRNNNTRSNSCPTHTYGNTLPSKVGGIDSQGCGELG
jgi:hypothetical protein